MLLIGLTPGPLLWVTAPYCLPGKHRQSRQGRDSRLVFQLFVTPWTVAHQASLSLRLYRQEYLSGLPLPSPGDLPHPWIKSEFPANAADIRDPGPVPGLGSPLEKEMATHSHILAWRILWTEEPGGLQSLAWPRV